ncbi:MAG: YhcH/YjgK/YiaL family protein [Sphaerochaetaceae bacterium]
MIYSNIQCQRDKAAEYPAAINCALEFLRKQNPETLTPGEYPIEGKDMYAKVFTLTTEKKELCKNEFHLKYIDVQFWMSGREMVGVAPDMGGLRILESHVDRDLYFCEQPAKESFIQVSAGDFMVFFPSDIHRPGCSCPEGSSVVKKVVVKVSVALLDK